MKEAMAPHFGIDAGVGCFCLQERTFDSTGMIIGQVRGVYWKHQGIRGWWEDRGGKTKFR